MRPQMLLQSYCSYDEFEHGNFPWRLTLYYTRSFTLQPHLLFVQSIHDLFKVGLTASVPHPSTRHPTVTHTHTRVIHHCTRMTTLYIDIYIYIHAKVIFLPVKQSNVRKNISPISVFPLFLQLREHLLKCLLQFGVFYPAQ